MWFIEKQNLLLPINNLELRGEIFFSNNVLHVFINCWLINSTVENFISLCKFTFKLCSSLFVEQIFFYHKIQQSNQIKKKKKSFFEAIKQYIKKNYCNDREIHSFQQHHNIACNTTQSGNKRLAVLAKYFQLVIVALKTDQRLTQSQLI